MILGVCSNKGGVGKTTVSTLLAAYTAKHTGKKILLIDADHNRGSSSVFFSNREPEDSIFEVAGAGFGCVMMNTSLIKRVADEFGLPFSPMMGFGEDLSFCWRVNQLGIPMFCDTRIKCGHIGQMNYNEDYYKAQGIPEV